MPTRTTTKRAGQKALRSNAGGALRGQARAAHVRALNTARRSAGTPSTTPTTQSPGRSNRFGTRPSVPSSPVTTSPPVSPVRQPRPRRSSV